MKNMKEKDQKSLMIINNGSSDGDELIYLIEWFNETELDRILELMPDELSITRLIGAVQVLNELSSIIYPDREKLDKLYEILESNVPPT